ncbi:MAG: HEAT repeat domain-containing protein [Deltaproteobacteria bacterium]|nr:HEAT repeat domain-containing protein [Deltaproteobacteria bacterium]
MTRAPHTSLWPHSRAWRCRGLTVLALSSLLGCATTGSPPLGQPGDEAPDEVQCPEAPPALSRVEQLRLLSRATREVRANLLVQAQAGGQRIVATLHPPRLALARAVLATPRRARRRDPQWLARHIYTTFVELQCPKKLTALERAPTKATLRDNAGHRLPLLSLERHREPSLLRYRLVFSPPSTVPKRGRWTLEIPTETALARFHWAPSTTDREHLDALPLLFSLAQLRRVHQARWIALSGATARAQQEINDLLDCSKNPKPAQRLLTHLRAKLPAPHRVSLDIPRAQGFTTDEPGLVNEDATNLRAQIALRVALFRRLALSAARGLLSPKLMAQALTHLHHLAATLRAGKSRIGSDDALAFDRLISQGITEALPPNAPLHPVTAPVTLLAPGLVPPSAAVVNAALQLRIAAASRGFEPRWFSARGHTSLNDIYPTLHATVDTREIFADTQTRLGAGYWHPGLPKGQHFTVTFVDRGAAHWRDLATHARDEDALRLLAARVLTRERLGVNAGARALAINGLVQLRKTGALSTLLPFDPKAPTAPTILRAIATLDDPRVTSLLRRYASTSETSPLRIAAIDGLGRRKNPKDLPYLLAAMHAPKLTIARSALRSLLQRQRREATTTLTTWLRSPGPKRQAALKVLASWSPTPALATTLLRPLQKLLRGPQIPSEVLMALAKLGNRRASVMLNRLYTRTANLRPSLLRVAAKANLLKILLRATPSQPLDVTLQRRVVSALARQPRLAETELRAWLAESHDALVQGAAQIGLARLHKGAAILALGALARGVCRLRTRAVPILAPSMNASSRRRLLLDAITACPRQGATLWRSIIKLQPKDRNLLRLGLGHSSAMLRVQAALTLLAQGPGAPSETRPQP